MVYAAVFKLAIAAVFGTFSLLQDVPVLVENYLKFRFSVASYELCLALFVCLVWTRSAWLLFRLHETAAAPSVHQQSRSFQQVVY